MALEFAGFATAESFFPTMTHAICGIAFAFILIGYWSSMKGFNQGYLPRGEGTHLVPTRVQRSDQFAI